MLFISPEKLFLFSRYLDFCSCRKRRDQKDRVIFKFYDITNWETNKSIKHIAQYLKK